MTPITSHDNAQLKEIRKLTQRRRERERAGRFVAEGEDLLAAADAAGWEPLARLCAAGTGLPGIEVDPKLLSQASGIASGTRAVAVYAERFTEAPLGPVCVYLHGVGDPGNVGTILRGASAFGAGSVALGPQTADPYSPKAVRASMGAVFEVPLVRIDDPPDLDQLPGTTVALVADDGVPLAQVELSGPVTVLVGSERDGLPAAVVSGADTVARIPIANHSLNAAMAATIALYELSRMPR
jgi:RNA methyltransferase, TrmH family